MPLRLDDHQHLPFCGVKGASGRMWNYRCGTEYIFSVAYFLLALHPKLRNRFG